MKIRSVNNKGAALVMVIVAMMFVGIIAAIALTLTVGNSKSTKTTIDTSENFYSSESILNDLEIYLKKLATNAATKAYADALTDLAPGLDVDEKFQQKFANEMKDILLGDGTSTGKISGNIDADRNFSLLLLQEICYDRYDLLTKGGTDGEYTLDPSKIPINIKCGEITTTADGKVIIKDVTITLKENGYESTITTDITFDAAFPRTEVKGEEGEFNYPIDHYLLIAGKDIKPVGYSASPFTRGSMYGDYTGNVYAYKDLIINSPSDKAVNLKAASVIVGKDIIVDKEYTSTGKGTFTLGGISNDAVIYNDGASAPTGVWADNFRVYDGNATITGAKTNLGGNLELNGMTAEFTANGGELLAYSYEGDSVLTIDSGKSSPKSSAIILNGLGARLNLSSLSKLEITGTAYTAISDLGNIDKFYSAYDAPEAVTNLNFYTQGESITYRTLQALYLVPGSCIQDVGHNPMTKSELDDVIASVGELKISLPNDVKDFLSTSNPFIVHYERYVGDDKDKVYILWNFNSKADAVKYLDSILTSTANQTYFSAKELGDKQMGMLGTNLGNIQLPSSGVSLYGNAVYLEDGKLKYMKGNGAVSNRQDSTFNKLKSNISTSKDANSSDLVTNMFSGRLATYASGTQQTYNLVGPLKSNTDKEGNALTYVKQDGPKNGEILVADYTTASNNDTSLTTKYSDLSADYNYVLVTGENINWTDAFAPNTSYIFITPGDVKITSSGYFRGMIIAGGSISLPSNLKMECLGMLSYVQKIAGVEQPQVDTTEFQALLGVQKLVEESGEWFEDPSSGNFVLRQIFGVADTSAAGGSGSGDDFVSILTSEWKRN